MCPPALAQGADSSPSVCPIVHPLPTEHLPALWTLLPYLQCHLCCQQLGRACSTQEAVGGARWVPAVMRTGRTNTVGERHQMLPTSLLQLCSDTRRDYTEEEIQPSGWKTFFSLASAPYFFSFLWCFPFSHSSCINSIEQRWGLNSVQNPRKGF